MEYLDTIFASVVVLLFACYYMSNIKKRPPGPFGLPILGYLPFIGSHPAKKLYELSKKYGPVISLKLGPETFTVLNDYESIQEAFVQKGQLFSGRPKSGFLDALSRGYGIAYRQNDNSLISHRKFCLKTFRGFGADKEPLEKKIMAEIEILLSEITSSEGKPINCRTTLARAASNVINNITVGSRYSYDDKEFQRAVDVMNQDYTADKTNAMCFSLMLIAPALRFIPPFSSVLKVMMSGRNDIKDMFRKSLAEHRENLDKEHPRDFLDEYLLKIDTEEGASLSYCDEQLLETIIDLFLGGTETTATTISWSLLLFAHRPDIQNKLYEEISEVIGEGIPTMKHKSAMPYLNAFLLEIMRHRTLVPLSIPHTTSKSICFKGYDIPKGCTVLPNLWAVHHDPQYFQNPDEFNPDRFIDENGSFINDPRVIPFSLGQRYCVGDQIAKAELFLFLTSIIQRYEVKGDTATLPPFDDGIIGVVYVPKYFEVSFIPRVDSKEL